MKVVFFAGGFGTRLSEETDTMPKPMVKIGDKPVLWHIMKLYSHYGFNDFVILGGYKCYAIKEYFANYYLHQSDVVFDLRNNSMQIIDSHTEPWRITILDTGIDTMTGGRLKRAESLLSEEPFMLTYGDGVSNIDIPNLIKFHQSHGKAITMTAVQPEGRFGAIDLDVKTNRINYFMEKPKGDGDWINGGFFVCNPEIFGYIKDGDRTVWERAPLENLALDQELYAYKHTGFWKPMDTLRDKIQLEDLWNKGNAPWKVWKE